MKYIILPHPETIRQLPFYFAVEEFVARRYPDENCFFAWRVNPTVMLGRNQLSDNEVNIEYCKSNNIQIFRRKSGGGCIFADLGCIQFSSITSDRNVENAFANHMQRLTDFLQSIGIDAQLSGRNDIIVNDKKVAGTAFYGLKGRSVVHNSLLFDPQVELLINALTPSHEKLSSKGIDSVRQRVTGIAQMTKLDITQFMNEAGRFMCGEDCLTLSPNDMEEIAKIEAELASDDFVYGQNPKYTITKKHRFAHVGTIEAQLEIKNQAISDIRLTGDFFPCGDVEQDLLKPLKGTSFTREAVEETLEGHDLSTVIRGLSLQQFLRLLFGRKPHVMKPEWLKINLTTKTKTGDTADIIGKHHLNTICTSGLCPNRAECWAARTATLMIGGDICTRRCRFCNTLSGRPRPIDPEEPQHVAETVKSLGLRYAVITSVDRDDLPDYGADHWVKTIEAIKAMCPETKIELLIPDFMGRAELIRKVMETKPHVAGHNMETIRRLTPSVRSVAQYDRSLEVLKTITQCGIQSKTGFMLGLGETHEEIIEIIDDIFATGCRRLTIGQYLQPTAAHLPVEKYYTPQQFAEYKRIALEKGFEHVESGPLVRSSYHAEKA